MYSKKLSKKVNGDNIIYHYLQKNLLVEDNELSKKIIEKLLIDLSIWLPPDFYKTMPIILPYVIRDASCRKNTNNYNEEWGSANSYGFLRDDNTLIKGIVNSFIINSPNIKEYNKAKKGNGFVASHVWREINVEDRTILASTYHRTNSFVPNIVWLPKQISKLTDREGSYAQQVLQTLSHKIYSMIKTDEGIDDIWNILPNPDLPLTFDTESLNYFNVHEIWLEKRKKGLLNEIETIKSVLGTGKVEKGLKVKSSRYLPTLADTDPAKNKELIEWLDYYKPYIS